jgi:uncharacterized protein
MAIATSIGLRLELLGVKAPGHECFLLQLKKQLQMSTDVNESGETDLSVILKTLKPIHNVGDYVFCTVPTCSGINIDDVVMLFQEQEGYTIILKQDFADSYNLSYTYVSAWITLNVHSSLEAIGLTAAFSSALSNKGISCNVVAAFYHDHIFVDKNDVSRAMAVLSHLAK